MGNPINSIRIQVFVANGDGSSSVFEELPALPLASNIYELLVSPGLALNLAKGDIIEIVDRNAPARVLRRGGNFCIQIYTDAIPASDLDELEKGVQLDLQGSLDGKFGGSLALSVPASAGLDSINHFFDAFTRRTGIQWYFSNIYKNFEDQNDETLLDWWIVK